MTLLKKELRSNLKSFILWTSITAMLYFIVVMAYPSLINSQDLSSLMTMFPEELLKAFNMDITNISTASGWLFSEGIILYVIVGGLYSCIIGATIVLKEENDKTIEFLYSKPITKNYILTSKCICGFIYIIGFAFVVTFVNIIGLACIGDLNFGLAFCLLFSPLMIFASLYSISLLISTLLRKTKSVISLCFGIVFGFYFIQVFSVISEKVNFLKYLTVFSLSDSRYILEHSSINAYCVLISLIIIGLCVGLTYYSYNKKEFL